MINSPTEYDLMAEHEKELWWYKFLHEQTIESIKNLPLSTSDLIIDMGCGTGLLMEKLKEIGYNVIGVDLSDFAINICTRKNLKTFNSSILYFINNIPPELSPKLFIFNDSLCYFTIDEQLEILKKCNSIIKNGYVIINSPSIESFKGTHDIAVGIKVRLNKKKFNNILAKSNFKIVKIEYWPFLPSIPIFAIRKFQLLKLRIFKNNKIISDLGITPKSLNKIFYNICKFESRYIKKIWGTSLFIVAKN